MALLYGVLRSAGAARSLRGGDDPHDRGGGRQRQLLVPGQCLCERYGERRLPAVERLEQKLFGGGLHHPVFGPFEVGRLEQPRGLYGQSGRDSVGHPRRCLALCRRLVVRSGGQAPFRRLRSRRPAPLGDAHQCQCRRGRQRRRRAEIHGRVPEHGLFLPQVYAADGQQCLVGVA